MIGSVRGTAIKLGIFTVVTIVVTTWLASIIGNFRFFASPYEVTAEFTDATGVLNGDVVKAAGVTVGKVSSIEIDRGVAVVTLTIDEGVELPADAGAEIRFRNLIGQRMVSLVEAEDPSGEILEAGAMIPLERTEPAFDLTALFNGLRPLIRSSSPADINLVSRELVKALQGRSANVEGFLGNVAEVTEMLGNKDREIDSMLDNLGTVTADLAGRDAQLQTTLGAMNSFFADVAAGREDLAVALETLDSAASRFNRIIERNDDNITVELRDLRTIFDAVNDRRGELRRAIRSLPRFLVGVERTNSYGQWSNIHLIHACKDDQGTCGSRWMR